MSNRKDNEYRYTVEGWLTEAAFSQGLKEVAERGDKRLTMTGSLGVENHVNRYIIHIGLDDKTLYLKSVTSLKKAREMFIKLCLIHRLNHKRYNPQ